MCVCQHVVVVGALHISIKLRGLSVAPRHLCRAMLCDGPMSGESLLSPAQTEFHSVGTVDVLSEYTLMLPGETLEDHSNTSKCEFDKRVVIYMFILYHVHIIMFYYNHCLMVEVKVLIAIVGFEYIKFSIFIICCDTNNVTR